MAKKQSAGPRQIRQCIRPDGHAKNLLFVGPRQTKQLRRKRKPRAGY